LSGPSLKPEDVTAFKAVIDRELEASTPAAITGETLFSDIPVDGWFRYRDRFQIVPVPSDAPRGTGLFGANPFIIQFTHRPSSSMGMLTGFRIAAQVRRIQILLNALLEVRISKLNPSRFHWVIMQMNPLKTEYRQEMYVYPDSGKFRGGETFTPVEGIAPLVKIEPQEYYTRQIVVNSGISLQIPANLEFLLDRFYSSTSADQDRFLRACFWFNFAQTAATESSSAAFTALISAIESLIAYEQPDGHCPVCRRPMGKGSTRRLAEFLDNFAPATPKFQEARAKLYYEFRSRLSHGGELSFSDRTGHFLGLTPTALRERTLQYEVWGLVKLVLVNWLHSRSALLVKVDRG
jgi:hypothetical protein